MDSIAGPSEILVLADETANSVYVAADLLSQAEHDELAGAILITTSQELADRVAEEISLMSKINSFLTHSVTFVVAIGNVVVDV